jgi:cytochrome c-type biogenesis protein CcmE
MAPMMSARTRRRWTVALAIFVGLSLVLGVVAQFVRV